MQLAERPAGNGKEDTKKMSPQLQATGQITINLSVTHTQAHTYTLNIICIGCGFGGPPLGGCGNDPEKCPVTSGKPGRLL